MITGKTAKQVAEETGLPVVEVLDHLAAMQAEGTIFHVVDEISGETYWFPRYYLDALRKEDMS